MILYIPQRYIQTPDAPLEYFQSILFQRLKIDFNIHMFEEPFVETNEVSSQHPWKLHRVRN